MITKNATTSFPINELISKRWSSRLFDPTKDVERVKIYSICEAARWAPSCFGDEPWRFIILDKNHNYEDYKKGFNCLGEWNQKWVKNAPVLIIAISDTKFRKNRNDNKWAGFDTGAACENIYLQAVSLNLNAHPMAGFDVDKTRNDFNIPLDFIPMAMIAIGYQSDNMRLVEQEFQTSEQSERTRRPIGENFFDGKWDKGIL
jgi:nitroreductase